MNKERTNKLIPESRFPEFANEGEWQYLYGNKLFQSISNKNHKSDLPILAITQDQGAIPRDLINYNVIVTEKSVESYKVVEIGDFIIGLRSFQGGIEYSKYKGICSPAYIILRKIKKESQNEFYRYYFKTNLYIRDLNKNLEGIRDGKMISYAQFSEILLPSPNPIEQQKIADCLSSLDELITVHSDKLEALKTYKKGLMQNIFPQEGEKVPKFRFKEFVKDEEWDRKTLGEISLCVNEKVGDRKFTLISIDSGIGLISQLEKFGREIAGNSYSNYIVMKRHDFAFNKSSTKIFPEGQISILDKYESGAVPNSIFTCFRAKIEKVYPYYLKFLFDNNIHGKWLRKFIAIGARANGALNINNNDLFALQIPLPNMNEQVKIAETLLSLDELILQQTNKLEQTKSHKKGLMQCLFPKTNE
ncbi:MAG: restriction endonuclease subunit S [Flavobacterium sp.]|uniref:restriction endonuclease subunit S n=1 Tax=Flavobacterium sp. TaxID=239 RepID=UPI003D0FC6B7